MDTGTKRILIAVDGSQPSMWAVSTGAALAARIGAEVVVLHVIVPPTVGASEIALVTDDLIERLKSEGRAVVEAAVRRLPATTRGRTILGEGYPAQEILAQARDLGADFIVMGSRGRGRWAHFILGSIAEAVIREAPCPVVSVSHEPAPTSGTPEAARQAEPHQTAAP